MLIFKLILRNIIAHKLRNIIIFLIITVISCTVFLFLSFSDGEIDNINKSIMGLLSPKADLTIKAKGYLEAYNANEKEEDIVKRIIKDYPDLINKLKEKKYIKKIYVKTRQVEGNIFSNKKRFQGFEFIGLDANNSDYIKSKLKMIEGNYIEEDDKCVLLIHINIKGKMNLSIGEKVSVIGQDLFGQSIVQEYKIIGFYKPLFDNPIENRDIVFTDMQGYNIISGLFPGEAHTINIELEKGTSINNSIKELNEWALKNNLNIEFNNYFAMSNGDIEIYFAFRLILMIISAIVILIIMFGIMNIISNNLDDRKKEIGSFYCLGAEKLFLTYIYSFEILIVNIFASLCGICLGFIFSLIINSINLTTDDSGMQLVFGAEKFTLGVSLETVIFVIAGIVIITLLTSYCSLNNTLKVSPTVAVREAEE